MQRRKREQKGFTLLEILLVIAAIGILAAIVLVAINPTKQLAQIRNAQRLSNINTIFKAIEQNTIDTGGAYPGTVGGYKDICPIGIVNTSCIDLSGLVPIYMAGIPVDPRGGNYKIGINPDNNRISVKASDSELGQKIVINEITMKVEYLIIGGGGSGGVAQGGGGGGGAGGYRSSVFGELSGGSSPAESRLALSTQPYTVTVGTGGVIPVGQPAPGNSGSSSSFGGITALGGGGGSAGGTWGSGGGAGFNNVPPAGAGTAGQGTNGGPYWDQVGGDGYGGGGGGGAGTAAGGGGFGGSAPVAFAGAGLTSSITGAPVARAGGGTPGRYGNAGLGSSGPGGGGTGSASNNGFNGPVTAGKDGIVIIRYITGGPSGTVSATGGTKTTVGEYTIHTFTTSGTFTLIEY